MNGKKNSLCNYGIVKVRERKREKGERERERREREKEEEGCRKSTVSLGKVLSEINNERNITS